MFDALFNVLKKFHRTRLQAPATAPGETPARVPSNDSTAKDLPWMDLDALMAIECIELRVQRIVQGICHGQHRSSRRGYSAEFSEYRPYSPGDDLRHLDWRRLARTDRPLLRQYEDESKWSCLVIIDLSGSMAYGSLGHTKADYAKTLAGTLGVFFHNQGDSVGLLRLARDSCEVVPPAHSSKQLSRWWKLLAAGPSGLDSSLGSAISNIPLLLKRPGLVVVISDFLCDSQTWAASLNQVRSAQHEVVFLEVLDPQELDFHFTGDTRFQDLETSRLMELDASRARATYVERINAHRNRVAQECHDQSVLLLAAHTQSPLEPVFREFFPRIGRHRARGTSRQEAGIP